MYNLYVKYGWHIKKRSLQAFLVAICLGYHGFSQTVIQQNKLTVASVPMQTFAPNIPQGGKSVSLIPQNFSTYGLAFFCRQELKLQQVHVPLVFRIGSMENCNYLEQKPGYKNPDTK